MYVHIFEAGTVCRKTIHSSRVEFYTSNYGKNKCALCLKNLRNIPC